MLLVSSFIVLQSLTAFVRTAQVGVRQGLSLSHPETPFKGEFKEWKERVWEHLNCDRDVLSAAHPSSVITFAKDKCHPVIGKFSIINADDSSPKSMAGLGMDLATFVYPSLPLVPSYAPFLKQTTLSLPFYLYSLFAVQRMLKFKVDNGDIATPEPLDDHIASQIIDANVKTIAGLRHYVLQGKLLPEDYALVSALEYAGEDPDRFENWEEIYATAFELIAEYRATIAAYNQPIDLIPPYPRDLERELHVREQLSFAGYSAALHENDLFMAPFYSPKAEGLSLEDREAEECVFGFGPIQRSFMSPEHLQSTLAVGRCFEVLLGRGAWKFSSVEDVLQQLEYLHQRKELLAQGKHDHSAEIMARVSFAVESISFLEDTEFDSDLSACLDRFRKILSAYYGENFAHKDAKSVLKSVAVLTGRFLLSFSSHFDSLGKIGMKYDVEFDFSNGNHRTDALSELIKAVPDMPISTITIAPNIKAVNIAKQICTMAQERVFSIIRKLPQAVNTSSVMNNLDRLMERAKGLRSPRSLPNFIRLVNLVLAEMEEFVFQAAMNNKMSVATFLEQLE